MLEKKDLKTLFIIDDDPDILVLAKYILNKSSNIEVKCFPSAETAIQEALISPPDMILLDVMMPQMDGIAALQVFKSLPKLKHIPIIFFTAKAREEELSQYYKLGIINVIIKPFDPTSFAATLQQIWSDFQSPLSNK